MTFVHESHSQDNVEEKWMLDVVSSQYLYTDLED